MRRRGSDARARRRPIRRLLADDQALVRAGFRALLDAQHDIEVVGRSGRRRRGRSTGIGTRPDVVLMDIRMPGMDGLAATRRSLTTNTFATVRVVILTTFGLDEYVFEAIRSGASGFLVKDTEPEELVQAVRVVAGGDALLSPSVTRKLIAEFAARAKEPPGSRAPRGAHGSGAGGRRPRRRGAVEPRDRPPALHQPGHGQDACEPCHGQARRARPSPARGDRVRVGTGPPRLARLTHRRAARGTPTGVAEKPPAVGRRPVLVRGRWSRTRMKEDEAMETLTSQEPVPRGRDERPAIHLEDVTKRFGDRTAVNGLSIDVPEGVVAGFVGPNGAGKSTTLRILLGLVRPTSGTGTVLGQAIDDPASYLARVGGLIEGPAFHPALSGRRNLEVLAALGAVDAAEIPGLLRQVGLGSRGDDPYRTYSLGMKQRLGIAGALLGEPELLLLDEPSNGLDPAGIHEMRALIGTLSRADRTVLVSSHMLTEVEQVCDWLIMIEDGRLVYQGPTADLMASAVTGLTVAPRDRSDLGALRTFLVSRGRGGGRRRSPHRGDRRGGRHHRGRGHQPLGHG